MTRLRLLVLSCAVVFLACHDNESDVNPNYKEPTIWGFLVRAQDYDSTDVQVIDYDGLRMVPTVFLNDRQVQAYSYLPSEYEYGDDSVLRPSQKYELNVKHYWGTGFCHVVMPGDFDITRPTNGYLLRKDSTLVGTWSKSQGAEWYWLSIYVDYSYYDTTGDTMDEYEYEFELDTLVTDTSIWIPPDRLFPPVVGQLINGDGSVRTWSGYGPPLEPGDLGNVRGNAVGFVNAWNEPPEREFYVGAPTLTRHAPDSRTMLERLKARLRSRVLTR